MVMMHREYREVLDTPFTNRYGIVLSQENTFQSDALEGLMEFVVHWERFADPKPSPEKAIKRWAAMAKKRYGVDVDISSYRRFFETMPQVMMAFYEDPSYPISQDSKLE